MSCGGTGAQPDAGFSRMLREILVFLRGFCAGIGKMVRFVSEIMIIVRFKKIKLILYKSAST